MKLLSLNLLLVCTFFCACKSKKPVTNTNPLATVKSDITDTSIKKNSKAPIINIADTFEVKRIVLCIKDSAANSIRLASKLQTIFNKLLPTAIKASKITINGAPIVWYKSQKAPYFFEAGLPVDKAPAKLAKGVYIKNTGTDSALVAHYFGPNDQSQIAYDALNETLKDRGKNKLGAAYEIYINNPFDSTTNKADLYKLQTDIIIPYK